MNIKYNILGIAALLLCSCSNSETPEQTAMEIAVSASLASPTEDTRATPITNINQLDALEISVIRNDSGQSYFTDIATPNGSVFSFPTPHYWLPGAPLDFYAHTPSPHISNLIVGNGAIKFNYTAAPAGVSTDGEDVLVGVAFSMQYGDTNGGVVPLKLRHALAMIEFAVAYEEDSEGNRTSKIGKDVIITNIALHNMARAGICKLTNSACEWTVGSSVEWIEADFTRPAEADEQADFSAPDGTPMCGLRMGRDIFAGDVINTSDRSKALIVVPDQQLVEMRVSFVEGSPAIYSKVFPIEPIMIESGKYYRFDLSIKSNDVTVWSTKVTDWIEAEGGEITLQ